MFCLGGGCGLDGRPQSLPLALLVVRRPQLHLQQPPPERMLLIDLRIRSILQPGTELHLFVYIQLWLHSTQGALYWARN